MPKPYTQTENVYEQDFTELYSGPSEYEPLSLDMDDAVLDKMLVTSLNADRDHWNKKPWRLEETDIENTDFLLGDQTDDKDYLRNEVKYQDNRLFSSSRAILSYATGQLAKPDITPSRGDEIYLKGARDTGAALYQDSADDHVDLQVRAACLNLISRKRAYIKLRYDPNIGKYGKVVSEVLFVYVFCLSIWVRHVIYICCTNICFSLYSTISSTGNNSCKGRAIHQAMYPCNVCRFHDC